MTMTPQMDVLYLSTTGHVLAIFTRVSEPAKIEADATSFLDQGYHLRPFGDPASVASFGNHEFLIPAGQVSLLRTDLASPQVIAPRQSQLGLPIATPLSIQPIGPAVALTYAAPKFTGPASPSTIFIYSLTSAPAGPIQTLNNTLTVTGLTPGNYFAIAFGAGQPISTTLFTVI